MREIDLIDIRSQLEEEMTWRSNEIRLLRNQLAYIEDDEDKKRYRKALVVMLYSHYEGFCRTAFLIYVDAINKAKVLRKAANDYIVACSFAEEFQAYEDASRKPEIYRKIFGNKLPDDTKLHSYARQVDFISNMHSFLDKPVTIPDTVVDTESNLWPVVLKKILFRLGLPYDAFKEYEGQITMLLNRRNGIAHGRDKEGFDENTYSEIEKATFEVMKAVIEVIMSALKEKRYLKESC
ncbi:hypothetical protein SAMN05192569_101072 [Parageobacillus thermantarcticus]|jgi:hypothetical protein|uniref:MAE-28990/MAE-18760-like HEPN domain-containing protein n=1 Tax=Parageobacillus thermantarcticus TaxID=186116 RepID=A0A1I0T2E0_9BACL|nr:MAE_28990/MAE_18760 family HEPN-like nuclease [Parageobacillus thermantarcticus]SFA45932.1 hypothetical protein SAMN05192569_101072 [Parageobacillus thermantarcticus]